MVDSSHCQIPCLIKISEGNIFFEKQPFKQQIKRLLAKPWNYYIKKIIKKVQKIKTGFRPKNSSVQQKMQDITIPDLKLTAGDWVRVRSKTEIQSTLDNWNELRGCAFLANMWQYCGTTHQVLVSMKRFLDERDYKVKKCNGIILLNGVMCEGTPVFGDCDRRCHFFWREEWLVKISPPDSVHAEINP